MVVLGVPETRKFLSPLRISSCLRSCPCHHAMAWKVVGPEEVSLGATGAYHAMALAWVQKKFNETHMVLQLEEGIERHCARSFSGQGLGLEAFSLCLALCHHAMS